MRLRALYDDHGVVIAATLFDPEDDHGLRPVATDGGQVGEFEVPDEHRDLGLDELCRMLRVDAEAASLVRAAPSGT